MISFLRYSHDFYGLHIELNYFRSLQFHILNYFNSLYNCLKVSNADSLYVILYRVDSTPTLPSNIKRFLKSQFVTVFNDDKEIYFISKKGSVMILNPENQKAIGYIKPGSLDDVNEINELIGGAIIECLKRKGLYSIHSAGVYDGRRGYLIVGDSGCGKTTTTLSLVINDFKYVSDDFLLFKVMNAQVFVYPYFKKIKIDSELKTRFTELSMGGNPQISYNMLKKLRDSFITSIKPSAIIFPIITLANRSEIKKVGKIETYKRLLKQIVLAVDKGVSKNQVEALDVLVRQCTAYELLSGRDIYENPQKLIGLMNQIN